MMTSSVMAEGCRRERFYLRVREQFSASLPFIKEVLDLQREYPRAGRIRIYGLLDQQRDEPPPSERTVGRAMALNRRFHGAPGPWLDERP